MRIEVHFYTFVNDATSNILRYFPASVMQLSVNFDQATGTGRMTNLLHLGVVPHLDQSGYPPDPFPGTDRNFGKLRFGLHGRRFVSRTRTQSGLPTEVMLCDSEHSFKRHLKTLGDLIKWIRLSS